MCNNVDFSWFSTFFAQKRYKPTLNMPLAAFPASYTTFVKIELFSAKTLFFSTFFTFLKQNVLKHENNVFSIRKVGFTRVLPFIHKTC